MSEDWNSALPSEVDFLAQYDFGCGRNGCVGLEDEQFVTSPDGTTVVARADQVLARLASPGSHSCELSRAQLENNTGAHRSVRGVVGDLMYRRRQASEAAAHFGLRLVTMPVGPADMPQDITPNNERYAKMAEALKERGVLLPALRVTSLQPNISCQGWSSLLECYNRLVEALPRLMDMAERSNGERMRLYGQVVEGFGFDPIPRTFASPREMYRDACERGWVHDPSQYHPHIRIKVSTRSTPPIIEVRPFDAIGPAEDISEVLDQVLSIAVFRF